MKPRMNSNASIFDRRGNPWDDRKRQTVSADTPMSAATAKAEEVLKVHGLPSTRFAAETRNKYRGDEAPDIDAFTKAKKAAPHFEPGPEKRNPPDQRIKRAAAIIARMNANMKPKFVQVHRAVETPMAFVADKALKVKPYWLWLQYKDGSEEDLERGALKTAEKSFERLIGREDVVSAELWSNLSGECIKRYSSKPE